MNQPILMLIGGIIVMGGLIASWYQITLPEVPFDLFAEDRTIIFNSSAWSREVVTKVVDGDTIYTDKNKIRLSLTDTPERGEDGWAEATDFTKSICPVGAIALVNQDDMQPVDRYDRMVAKVSCNGVIVNSELLHNGHAVISTDYCDVSEFQYEFWAKEYGC